MRAFDEYVDDATFRDRLQKQGSGQVLQDLS
jgi:hypothetical protein